MILADSWTANTAQIVAAKPDLVIAAVPYQEKAVGEILKAGVRFLGLAPKSLADIYTDIATIAGMVGFIDGKNSVMVSDGTTKTSVGVVREGSKPPYIRSYADNKWTDNLLSLPRF